MLMEVENDLGRAAPTVAYRAGGQPARADIERGVPGMIDPGRMRQPVFSNDLAVKMKCRASVFPGLKGNIGPIGVYNHRGAPLLDSTAR